MELNHFISVIKYQVHSRILKHFFTPKSDVINAVKSYNLIRVSSAKKIAEILQECCVSETKINNPDGITLIVSDEEKTELFTVHRRFLKHVYNYYIIVHFDNEIFKMFKKWISNVFTSLESVTDKNIETTLERFLSYNNASNINLLYVKFNTVCEI